MRNMSREDKHVLAALVLLLFAQFVMVVLTMDFK
jgi:hypothetical protein